MTRRVAEAAFVCHATCVLLLTLAAAGCGRSNVENPASVSLGISWDSLLADATDFSTLARRINPAVKAKMFSSAADGGKVMLAHLAPEIIGDMDYGFFTEVATNRDGFSATLAAFTGPGVVTWGWSAKKGCTPAQKRQSLWIVSPTSSELNAR